MAQTGWLIGNRNLFLTVLEAGSLKIMVPASGEHPLPSHILFIKALIPFMRGFTLMT